MRDRSVGSIAAVILAGGRGERLGGVVKADIRVDGLRLLERVFSRLSQCQPVVVAHGPHDPLRLGLPAESLSVADLPTDYAGPLAGVAAAIAAMPDEVELLVCAAVDSPFLPADYVDRLVRGLGAAPAAIAAYDGQIYPTNSIWRLDACRDLPARVVAGTAPHSLKSLSAQLGGVTVDWPAGSDGDPFANINTPEDLALAEARAGVRVTGF